MLDSRDLQGLLTAAEETLGSVSAGPADRIKLLMVKSAMGIVGRTLDASDALKQTHTRIQSVTRTTKSTELRAALRAPGAHLNSDIMQAAYHYSLLQAHAHKPRNLSKQELKLAQNLRGQE